VAESGRLGIIAVSKFWQKTHRRLHQAKKIIPEPFQPRRQSSSLKWVKALVTRASRPLLQMPVLFSNNFGASRYG
jgi:hypothetical protein